MVQVFLHVIQTLRVLLVNLRVERKKAKAPVVDENRRGFFQKRSLRYCAYRAFVAWCYGRLGFGRRYELPACVRGAIMDAFPQVQECTQVSRELLKNGKVLNGTTAVCEKGDRNR
ncbi:hypothetical protein COOONC_22195 [Cooperia oncophora]